MKVFQVDIENLDHQTYSIDKLARNQPLTFGELREVVEVIHFLVDIACELDFSGPVQLEVTE